MYLFKLPPFKNCPFYKKYVLRKWLFCGNLPLSTHGFFFSGSWVFRNAVVLFFNLNEKKKDIYFVNGGCYVIHNDKQIYTKLF